MSESKCSTRLNISVCTLNPPAEQFYKHSPVHCNRNFNQRSICAHGRTRYREVVGKLTLRSKAVIDVLYVSQNESESLPGESDKR